MLTQEVKLQNVILPLRSVEHSMSFFNITILFQTVICELNTVYGFIPVVRLPA